MDSPGRLSYGALFCCVELLLMDKRGQPGRLSYVAPLQFPHAMGYGRTRCARPNPQPLP